MRQLVNIFPGAASLSARRAWIEMPTAQRLFPSRPSLSARRAWIEMMANFQISALFASLSARRAWIEMFLAIAIQFLHLVALRKESVDRNRLMELLNE